MIRTFIAVEVSPEVRRRAAEWIRVLQARAIEARWVDPTQMHLTLQFLGQVPEIQLPHICKAIGNAVASASPFDVVCTELGVFPDWKRPRVLWLGIGEGYEQLVELQQRVERALQPLGYRGEARRFEPHVTLGRLRRSDPIPEALRQDVQRTMQNKGQVGFDVSEVVVFSSQLSRQGPRYEAIGRAELLG
ncbi:MAG: RNA 2',3'-cyclic phosphodiesterase [Pirellulaceae bacterium]|nr:MAG: RNA 2',3'-cyclic phosphodiesterase [Pirellulaceae bacterium]